MNSEPAVWLPAVRVGTGADVFTRRLCEGLNVRGIRAEVTWLPHRAEYLPWTVPIPRPPVWANVVLVNTWLHPRFIPRGLPVLATLHHSVHDPALRPYKGTLRAAYHYFWIAPIERRVLRRAQKVVAVSRFAADMARKTLCEMPMEIVPNGIDISRFRPAEGRPGPHHPFRLLYVGGWMARKGVDLFAPIMRELGDGFVLHYTGGQAAEKDKPAMPANMHDIGRQQSDEAVITAMQNADVLLFPSRSEGFGLVAAEAMACGLPVIATHGSSLVEVVDDGLTGVLCQKDHVSEFVTAIRYLQGNPQRTCAMGDASRRRAEALFGIEEMLDAYISLCRTCLLSAVDF